MCKRVQRATTARAVAAWSRDIQRNFAILRAVVVAGCAALMIAGLLPGAVSARLLARNTVAEVGVIPEGDAASVLDVQVINVDPPGGATQRIKLVFHNQKAVVYNLTIRPGGLAGIPDNTPLLPVMAKRDLSFDTVIVPVGTEQMIQASKVGLDTRTTEELLLLDLLTVAEVVVSGEYPPTPDTFNEFLVSAVGGTVLDSAVDSLHNSGVDLASAVDKLSQDQPDFAGATQDVLSAMADAPEAFAQFARDIGWKGVLTDVGKVSEASDKIGVGQFVNSLSFFGDLLFAPSIVTFTLRAQPTAGPPPSPVPQPVLPAPAATPGPLYQANWSSGMNGWAGTSDWKVVNGLLVSDGSQGRGLVLAPLTAPSTDYAVEAEIQMTGRDVFWFGVVMRYEFSSGRGRFYVGGAGPGPGFQSAMTIFTDGMQKLGERPFSPGTGWHTYQLEAQGNALRLVVDGATQLEATDNRYLRGITVGLFSSSTQVSVRTFKISSL